MSTRTTATRQPSVRAAVYCAVAIIFIEFLNIIYFLKSFFERKRKAIGMCRTRVLSCAAAQQRNGATRLSLLCSIGLNPGGKKGKWS